MKTIEINLYKFSELSEQAKEAAIEKLSDINIDGDWFECMEGDAENVGIKIKSFDIDRASCNIEFLQYPEAVAKNIMTEHGAGCGTYKLAENYIANLAKIEGKYTDEQKEDEYDYENELTELNDDFIKDLGEEYLTMLRNEFEYLSSKEAIIETIEANDYDFTEDGRIYNGK